MVGDLDTLLLLRQKRRDRVAACVLGGTVALSFILGWAVFV